MFKKQIDIFENDMIGGEGAEEEGDYCYWYICPNCNDIHIQRKTNYCPNCGIKLNWQDGEGCFSGVSWDDIWKGKYKCLKK